MADLSRRYDQGVVTSRDRAELRTGEMQQATGAYYLPGDPDRIHKLPGRSEFGDTGSALKVDGLALCQFDSGGTDLVVALTNETLYKATPGLTGTFSSLEAVADADSLDAAHVNDRWYLALGTTNRVLKNDGTTRGMGMIAPPTAPTAAAVASGGVDSQPTADDSGFTNGSKAYDSDLETFAHTVLSAAGSDAVVFSGWGSNTGTTRFVKVSWSLVSSEQSTGTGGGIWAWILNALPGTEQLLGGKVRVTIEISEDSGSNYTTVLESTYKTPQGQSTLSYPYTNSTNTNLARVRVTLTYLFGAKQVALRVHDVRIVSAPAATLSATALLYAYSEYDEDEGIESVVSPAVSVALSSQGAVILTLPGTAQNSNTTHLKIYRTADQGTETELGVVGTIPVGQTSFLDDFKLYGVNDVPVVPVRLIQVTSEGGTQSYPRDAAPPALTRLDLFKGSLVGLSTIDTRRIFYSAPGFPDSWPAIFSFPLSSQYHDEAVDLAALPESLIIASKESLFRIDELPRSVGGIFVASELFQVRGAPGCVGKYAMTVVNYQGESHVAWISDEGVLVTNGHRYDRISDDIDWSAYADFDKSQWVLRYLTHQRILVLAYSSENGGGNDRYWLLHMDRHHMKEGGRAKVTGPHYGSIAEIATGIVSCCQRVYSAHWSDGSVYLELDTNTGQDASESFDSTTHRLLIKGRRAYEQWISWSALSARLYHSDFGDGEELTLDYLVGREASGHEQTKSQTVSLEGHGGTQLNIGRAGQYHEETLTHDGQGQGSIRELKIRARAQGSEGEMRGVA